MRETQHGEQTNGNEMKENEIFDTQAKSICAYVQTDVDRQLDESVAHTNAHAHAPTHAA